MTAYSANVPFKVKPLLIAFFVSVLIMSTANECDPPDSEYQEAAEDSAEYWNRNQQGYGSDGYGDDERML